MLTNDENNVLLMAHTFSGCDTVSSIFGFSKEKVFKLLSSEKNPVIAEIKTFHNNAISHEA